MAPPSPQASKTNLNKSGIRHYKDNKECGMERIRYRKGQYNAGQREACDAMSNLWGVARQEAACEIRKEVVTIVRTKEGRDIHREVGWTVIICNNRV